MAVKGLKVVVVGGGIIGASVAWHLSEIGANVTVLEKHSQPANGVTAHSYGWVGDNRAENKFSLVALPAFLTTHSPPHR